MDDLLAIEQKVDELSLQLEIEGGKVEEYETKMASYAEKIKKLTERIEGMEDSPHGYDGGDFEEVRVEIKQVEALVGELQLSINTTGVSLESIRAQVTAMVQTLTRLEKTFDKNLVLQTRREFVKLQVELEECENRYQEILNPNIGSCAHSGIIRVSKPVLSHINALHNSGNFYGAWGKDSKPIPDRETMYWHTARTFDDMVQIRFYTNYKNLITSKHFSYHTFGSGWEGLGNNAVLRDNTLYYHRHTFGLTKYNFSSQAYDYRAVTGASPSFSYTSSQYQQFDFAADETGLYVTYATDNGHMAIAKINEVSFGIEEVIKTSVFKPAVTNAFMVCGVLYTVRTVDTRHEEIFYKFDTRTKQGSYMSVLFERFLDRYTYLDYNPTDQKLYMFNQGYMVQYHLWFNQTTEATVEPPLQDLVTESM
ncbi:olfactomedin-4 [Synchiropus splendidus]|uniref:olfactomedin-4 n=1 Tax=Synchiropus splendidus TaxID=270530 RepID=UPI00237E5180|nr:olfactomedin-4 [Synchiropus splendidus]